MKKNLITTLILASMGLLSACGDSNEKLARQVCEEQMGKDSRVASMSQAEKDLALKLCVELATEALKNGAKP
ncbi:MAG: hypothetical protein JNK86_03400 [Alphaproteobacteria bacterium]|nr:hypothetical protein [Alphaproteobacteria bacterium]